MAPPLGLARPKIAMNGGFLRVLRRVFTYWRAIVMLLIFALAAAIVLNNQFVSFELVGLALLLIFIASQIFWIERVVDLGEWLLPICSSSPTAFRLRSRKDTPSAWDSTGCRSS